MHPNYEVSRAIGYKRVTLIFVATDIVTRIVTPTSVETYFDKLSSHQSLFGGDRVKPESEFKMQS